MPELKNIRHERFCFLYHILGNASMAYREAGFHSKNPDVNAAQLIVKHSIKARIAEIKANYGPKKVKSRDDVLQWLSDLMDRPADEPIKWGDKLRAGEIFVRMCGYNEPETINIGVANSLTTYLTELRSQRIGDGMFTVAGEAAAPVIELEQAKPKVDLTPTVDVDNQ
jgi:Terminase small subunit